MHNFYLATLLVSSRLPLALAMGRRHYLAVATDKFVDGATASDHSIQVHSFTPCDQKVTEAILPAMHRTESVLGDLLKFLLDPILVHRNLSNIRTRTHVSRFSVCLSDWRRQTCPDYTELIAKSRNPPKRYRGHWLARAARTTILRA